MRPTPVPTGRCVPTAAAQTAHTAHTYSGTMKSDSTSHWDECTVCGYKDNLGGHMDPNNDGKCDTCGYSMGTASVTVTFVNGSRTYKTQSVKSRLGAFQSGYAYSPPTAGTTRSRAGPPRIPALPRCTPDSPISLPRKCPDFRLRQHHLLCPVHQEPLQLQ